MSQITYDALKVEGLKEILIHVSKTCKELDIDFFIVGAVARNAWYISHDKNAMGTQDIDFGIFVPSDEKYNALRRELKAKYNYVETKENPFCLLTPDGKQIDLLPFGAIKNNEKILIEGKGITAINLEGFEEVYNAGIIEINIGEETYKISSIPGIIILKMIAYDDRPDQRVKDVIDINAICEHYPHVESDFIWSNHFDLYEGDRKHDEVAMIVLGRELKAIASENANLLERLVRILDSAIDQASNFTSNMIENPESETIEMKINLLKNIRMGLTELD